MDDLNEDKARLNRRQDIEDYNNETAGRDVGRIKRFFPDGRPFVKQGSDSDDEFNLLSEFVLTQQQKEMAERLAEIDRKMKLYDRATVIALQEIDEEIALAQLELQRAQDNATVLHNGRRVYRDEVSGHFYDEEDIRLSESDEVEAIERHESSDTSQQERNSAIENFNNFNNEREDIVQFKERQQELKERLEDNPEEASAIEDELDNMPVPERVQRHHDSLAANNHNELRRESATSLAKDILDNDSFKGSPDLNRAFANAHKNTQVTTPIQAPPRPERELTLG
ncbi:MAG: hypothetical protein V7731_01250 [Amphritea sp.]